RTRMHVRRESISSCATSAASPAIEQLETRFLLSATVRRGVLRIAGTTDGDDINVSLNRTKILVQINRTAQTFKTAGIRLARIDGGAGDDWISLSGKLPGLIIGGAGQDTVTGGAAADVIDGGDEADMLDGGAGNESVVGAGGDDTLFCGNGCAALAGEGGSDL